MTLIRKITALIFMLGSGCYAAGIYGTPAPLTGTRTENSGQIVTGGGYQTDAANFTLDWTVTQLGDLFTYRYDVSGYHTPGISHFIISLSEGCSLDPKCITNTSSFAFGVYNAT